MINVAEMLSDAVLGIWVWLLYAAMNITANSSTSLFLYGQNVPVEWGEV